MEPFKGFARGLNEARHRPASGDPSASRIGPVLRLAGTAATHPAAQSHAFKGGVFKAAEGPLQGQTPQVRAFRGDPKP